MRKTLAFLLVSMGLLFSSSTMFAAADKKDGKGGKDGKDKPDRDEKPFLPYIIWNGAWSPIMREAPMDIPTNTFQLTEVDVEVL